MINDFNCLEHEYLGFELMANEIIVVINAIYENRNLRIKSRLCKCVLHLFLMIMKLQWLMISINQFFGRQGLMFFVNRLCFIIQPDRNEQEVIFIAWLFYFEDLRMLVESVFLKYYFVRLNFLFAFILHFSSPIKFIHYFHTYLEILTFLF